MQAIAQVGAVSVDASTERPKDAAATVVDGIDIFVPLAGLIDAERERARLQEDIDQLRQELGRLDTRLADTQFVQKAPKEIIDQTRERQAQVRETIAKLSSHLAVLQAM